jgi:hypothetical protein
MYVMGEGETGRDAENYCAQEKNWSSTNYLVLIMHLGARYCNRLGAS